MTPQPSPTTATTDWHHDLARAIRDPGELVRRLGLPPSLVAPAHSAAELFGVMVPGIRVQMADSLKKRHLQRELPQVIGSLSVDMENFSNDFLNIVKRHFFS